MSKSITLYSHASGPNPWKVAMIMSELGVPYETEYMDMSVLKQEPFISKNPNGRVPAIEDPNTGVTVWESGACIDYLIDTYDKEGKLHYTQSPQKYTQRCWEHFQMSGQGPYFGQLAWFSFFHSEKNITSAIERYKNEAKRVAGVLNTQLSKSEYLVGDKISYADIMFVPWNNFLVGGMMPDEDWKGNYPKFYEWHQKLVSRPAIKKVLEEQEKVKASSKK